MLLIVLGGRLITHVTVARTFLIAFSKSAPQAAASIRVFDRTHPTNVQSPAGSPSCTSTSTSTVWCRYAVRAALIPAATRGRGPVKYDSSGEQGRMQIVAGFPARGGSMTARRERHPLDGLAE